MPKWNTYTIALLQLLGYFVAFQYGVFDYLLSVDITYFTLIIPALSVGCTIAVAVMCFLGKFPKTLRNQVEFITDHLTSLGLLGTMIGLWFAVKGGIPEPQVLLVGVGTALTTSIVGIAFTVLGNQVLLQLEEARAYAKK